MIFKIISLFLCLRKTQFRITQQNFLAAFSSGKISNLTTQFTHTDGTSISTDLQQQSTFQKPWAGGHNEKAAQQFNSNGLGLLFCYGKRPYVRQRIPSSSLRLTFKNHKEPEEMSRMDNG